MFEGGIEVLGRVRGIEGEYTVFVVHGNPHFEVERE